MKLYFIILGAFVFFLVASSHVLAGEDFKTQLSVGYTIDKQGKTSVSQTFNITNLKADIFASDYSLTIGSQEVGQMKVIDSSGNTIPHKVTQAQDNTIVTITFNDPVVGKGKVLTFTLEYEHPSITQKTGNTLELAIPKLAQSEMVDEYSVKVYVPVDFGAPMSSSPAWLQKQDDPSFITFTYAGDQVRKEGISLMFGGEQSYDFTLKYNLENTTITPIITQIALPPDTPHQKVYYYKISHAPQNMTVDGDGNWIATYQLEPKERRIVELFGSVVVYSQPHNPYTKGSTGDVSQYLKPQPYWQVDDPKIKSLAQIYNTPDKIYQYIVKTLSYDFTRIDNVSTARSGALSTLEKPSNSLCLEFSDAFITLARAAGIPARLHTGYAYTQNNPSKPLSLQRDSLHAWPEYYDSIQKVWRQVDPTWGSTSGVDYFNQFDVNHITFALQGLDSAKPYPAGYYKFSDSDTKDVEFSVSDSQPQQNLAFEIDTKQTVRSLFSPNLLHTITLTNLSNTAVYNVPVSYSGSGIITAENKLDYIIPFQTQDVTTTVMIQENANQYNVTVAVGGQIYEQILKPRFSIPIYLGLITLTLVMAAGIVFITQRTWHLLVQRRRR